VENVVFAQVMKEVIVQFKGNSQHRTKRQKRPSFD